MNAAAGIGLCVMLCIAAAAVVLFIRTGHRAADFEFLEKEAFETEYGVASMVESAKKGFPGGIRACAPSARCFASSLLPIFAALALSLPDVWAGIGVCLLLLLVAFGCYAFVYGGVYGSAMNKLLEEGDYTREQEKKRRFRCGEHNLLAHSNGNIPLLHLRSERKRPAGHALVYLGRGRSRYGAIAAFRGDILHSSSAD